MGDVKHIRLMVRGATQTKIQDAIHFNLGPAGGVDYHKYSKGSDGSSFTIEVGGRVDVMRLYECVKKLASSVNIEAVIPEGLKANTARLEQDLSNLKKQNNDLKAKLERAGEENSRLQMLEGQFAYRERHTHISIHERELEVNGKAKLKISGDSHRRIK